MSYTGHTEGAKCDGWLRQNCQENFVVPIETSVVSTIICCILRTSPSKLPSSNIGSVASASDASIANHGDFFSSLSLLRVRHGVEVFDVN
jgi:hypothetical protein